MKIMARAYDWTIITWKKTFLPFMEEKLNTFFSRFETSENTGNVNNFELQNDSPNTTGPHSLCSSLDVFKNFRKK